MDEPVLNWDLPDESEVPDINTYLTGLYRHYQRLIERPRMLPEQVPPLIMTREAYEQYIEDLKNM